MLVGHGEIFRGRQDGVKSNCAPRRAEGPLNMGRLCTSFAEPAEQGTPHPARYARHPLPRGEGGRRRRSCEGSLSTRLPKNLIQDIQPGVVLKQPDSSRRLISHVDSVQVADDPLEPRSKRCGLLGRPCSIPALPRIAFLAPHPITGCATMIVHRPSRSPSPALSD